MHSHKLENSGFVFPLFQNKSIPVSDFFPPFYLGPETQTLCSPTVRQETPTRNKYSSSTVTVKYDETEKKEEEKKDLLDPSPAPHPQSYFSSSATGHSTAAGWTLVLVPPLDPPRIPPASKTLPSSGGSPLGSLQSKYILVR